MRIDRSLRLDLAVYLSFLALLCIAALAVGVYGIVIHRWEPLLLPAVAFGTLLGCWIYFRRKP